MGAVARERPLVMEGKNDWGEVTQGGETSEVKEPSMEIVNVEDGRASQDHPRDQRHRRWELEILESASDSAAPVRLRQPGRQLRILGTPDVFPRATLGERQPASCPARSVC